MRWMLLLVAATAACIKPPGDKTETGPQIAMVLDPTDGTSLMTSSEDFSPHLTLPTGATMYSFKVFIPTMKGEDYDGNSYMHPTVSEASATLTLAGANIPPLTFDINDTMSERTFDGHDTITVASSFKTMKMHGHAEAKDTAGLASNIVDFDIELR